MTDETEDQELKELEAQIEELNAQEKSAASQAEEPVETQPETPTPPTLEEAPVVQQNVSPTPAQEKPSADDPLKWAKQKGLETPEEIARSYQKLEQEFSRRNQNKHPGYQDWNGNGQAPAPVPPPNPGWNPQPQAPAYGYPPVGYGYPPPPPLPPSRADVSKRMAEKYGMDPEDVDRLMPLIVDASEAIASRRTAAIENKLMNVERRTSRSEEIVRLSQDPAFMKPEVQQEIHGVFASDPSLLQRPGGYESAFQQAVMNLYRKQLQQGFTPDSTTRNNPPVTAGGGNGSASATRGITAREVESWSLKDQEAFINSGGRILPKR